MANREHEGGCVCGKVRYRVTGPVADVIACHCHECRRMSGHVFAATAVPRDAFTLTEPAALQWYRSSPTSRRGFCKNCGSSLFFDHGDHEPIGISAGSFDSDLPVKLVAHIYVDEAASYYAIDDSVEQFDACRWRNGGWSRYR